MLIGILKGTPIWVYILFVYLVMKGVQTLKPRVVPLSRLFVLPLVFLIWGSYSLITDKLTNLIDLGLWLAPMAAGFFAGYRTTCSIQIKADKKKNLVALPGSAATLVLSMAIFAIKYFFGFYYATHSAPHWWVVTSLDLIASGFLIGMLIGRSLCYWRLFQRAEQTDLIAK